MIALVSEGPDMVGQWGLFLGIVGLVITGIAIPLTGLVVIAWRAGGKISSMDSNTRGVSESIGKVEGSVNKLAVSVDEAVKEIRHIDGRLVEHERRDTRIEQSLTDHERRLGIMESKAINHSEASA